MKRLIPLFLAVLCLCLFNGTSSSIPASPSASPSGMLSVLMGASAVAIEGPSTAEPGDLVVLRAGAEAKGYAWECIPKNGKWVIFEGGKTVVFASGKSGEYTFLLATSTGDVPTIATKTVTIGIVPPGPGPVPPGPIPPNPNPPGPVPDGAFGLTKFCFTESQKVVVAERTRLVQYKQPDGNTINIPIHEAFGRNFAAVGSGLSTGAYLNIASANADLKSLNSATLGPNRDPWMPFFQAEANEVQRLTLAGTVVSTTQLGEAYKAVSEGLKLSR